MWVAIVVLALGAFLPMAPSTTWTNEDDDSGAAGAPQVIAGPDGLQDARRATGEAGSQLGLLTAATSQLVGGTAELDEGTRQLIDALAQAEAGSQQLSSGMVELQAGTGQLAAGATEVADAVGGVIDEVSGFEAVRGQVVAAIDRALEGTRESRDPEVEAARVALTGLREQAVTAELPPDTVAQMEQLRTGSREVANQLSTPGYAYHDGVYAATSGAADLAKGLAEINSNAGAAQGGVGELVDGAQRIDSMANQSAQSVRAVRAALPVASGAGAGSGTTGTDAGGEGTAEGAEAAQAQPEPEPQSSFSPVAAMLVAALLTLGGVALAGVAMSESAFARRGPNQALRRRRGVGVMVGGAALIAAAGWLLTAVVGTGLGAGQLALCALVLLLGALASAGLSASLAGAFGMRVGVGVAAVLALVQIGVVGWVWRTAAAAPLAGGWAAASATAPMHWTTAALSAAGNHGSQAAMVSGMALSLVMAVLGLAIVDKYARMLQD